MRLLKATGIPHLAGVPFKLLSQLDFISYEEDTPTENARKLHEREVDLALIPIVEFAQHGGYQSLEFGMGTRQRTESMILYANSPVESLERIHIYNCSSTSMLLLRLLLRERWGVDPHFVRRQECELFNCVGPNEGALALHELPGMIRYDFEVVEDLATAWYELTGKPFVFLVWAMRPDAVTPEEVLAIHQCLHRAAKASGAIAREYAPFFGTTEELAQRFIADHRRFYIDQFLLDGMQEFLSRAYKLDMLPKAEYRIARTTVMGSGPIVRTQSRTAIDMVQDVLDGYRLTMKDALWLADSAALADLSCAVELLRLRTSEVEEETSSPSFQAPEQQTIVVRQESLSDDKAVQRLAARMKRAKCFRSKFEINASSLRSSEFYVDLFTRLRATSPGIQIEAFDIAEILQLAQQEGKSVERLVQELSESGLTHISGLSGSMLLDTYMKRRGRPPVTVDQWAMCVRWLHRYGAHCSCTMRVSPFENWEERLIHLQKLRTIQDENPGFSHFLAQCPTEWNDPERLELYLRASMIARIFLDTIPCVEITLDQSDQIGSVFGRAFVADISRVEIS